MKIKDSINNKLAKKKISPKKDLSPHSLLKSSKLKASDQNPKKINFSYILPQINTSFLKKPLFEPTSILTKFIKKKTSSLIEQANSDINKIKIKPINYLSSSNINSSIKKKLSIKDQIANNNQKLIPKIKLQSKSESLLITETNINNNNNSNNLISEINNNNNRENLFNNKEISSINEKELNELIPTKSFPSNKISNPLTSNNDLNISEINSKNESENKNKIISPTFRRLCTYHPTDHNILSKSDIKKKLNYSIENVHRIYYLDLKFQSKIFNEQMNLIEDNLKQYRICINKDNYITIFKSMPLNTKIKYNQSLEEIFGILLIIPKILLGNYYKLMYGLKEIDIPKKKKFQSLYIYDEVEKVIKNNQLLSDTNNYFKKSFEFYLILINEVESGELALKKNDYIKLLSYYEKVRNNLCYVTNSFYNAQKNYEEDISTIKKICNNNVISLNKDDFNNDDSFKDINFNLFNDKTKKKENELKVVDKISGQFFFKKNKEKQKIFRVDNALGSTDKKIRISNYLGKEINKKNNNKYKSIFDSKFFNKILHYCDEETRIQIISNKINNDEKKVKLKGFKTIKINL